EHCENLAITGLRSSQPIETTKSPTSLQAEVHNFGAQPHHAQLELLIDGQRFQERPIDIAPGAQQTVSFAHRFEAPGDHSVEVRLTGDPLDALDIDDHRWLSVPVKESLEALLVNGEGSHEQARYLFNALDPYRDGTGSPAVHVEETSDGRLLEIDLHRFDCVFFSNVSQFTPAEARILADYAKSGGGLVFFLGDRVDPQNYNQELGGGRPGATRLLPALLDGPADIAQYSFDPLGYKDPIVREFQGNERAGLLSTAIRRYVKLKHPDPADPKARVALGIRETGDPAIEIAPIAGDSAAHGGWSIVVALPASFASLDPATKEPWSNWPLKYSFQPVVQNLLLAAIGPQVADRNVLVGKPIESTLPVALTANSLTLERPDGRKEQIRIATREDGNRWSYADTWQSGIYRADASTGGDGRLFAVNVDTRESDLARISADELPEGLTVVPGWNGMDERPAVDLGSRTGQQRWFLYTALGLLLSETVLAWWFGYRAS
ncbi:MAG TPA: hypothetical protein VG056_01070, partial [Pirellulales bacterium]|nr:hypothetical protein [Pirellulales bacterium]